MNQGISTVNRRLPGTIALLMLLEAMTFAIASFVHFNITIPLGLLTIHGESFQAAAIPEAVIAGVLIAGVIGLVTAPRAAWGLALGSMLFAILGVLIGLSIILGGRISRPGDVAYHLGVLAALIVTVALQLMPAARPGQPANA